MGAVSKRWLGKRGFDFLVGFREWWIRRKFKLILDDESIVLQEQQRRRGKAETDWLSRVRYGLVLNGREERRVSRYLLLRTNSTDSCGDSIESIDSLDGSYSSQATTVESSTGRLVRQDGFFLEHLNFLTVQTQPRVVEVVYNTLLIN